MAGIEDIKRLRELGLLEALLRGGNTLEGIIPPGGASLQPPTREGGPLGRAIFDATFPIKAREGKGVGGAFPVPQVGSLRGREADFMEILALLVDLADPELAAGKGLAAIVPAGLKKRGNIKTAEELADLLEEAKAGRISTQGQQVGLQGDAQIFPPLEEGRPIPPPSIDVPQRISRTLREGGIEGEAIQERLVDDVLLEDTIRALRGATGEQAPTIRPDVPRASIGRDVLPRESPTVSQADLVDIETETRLAGVGGRRPMQTPPTLGGSDIPNEGVPPGVAVNRVVAGYDLGEPEPGHAVDLISAAIRDPEAVGREFGIQLAAADGDANLIRPIERAISDVATHFEEAGDLVSGSAMQGAARAAAENPDEAFRLMQLANAGPSQSGSFGDPEFTQTLVGDALGELASNGQIDPETLATLRSLAARDPAALSQEIRNVRGSGFTREGSPQAQLEDFINAEMERVAQRANTGTTIDIRPGSTAASERGDLHTLAGHQQVESRSDFLTRATDESLELVRTRDVEGARGFARRLVAMDTDDLDAFLEVNSRSTGRLLGFLQVNSTGRGGGSADALHDLIRNRMVLLDGIGSFDAGARAARSTTRPNPAALRQDSDG